MPLANVFAPMGFRLLDNLPTAPRMATYPTPAGRVIVGAAASADIAIGDACAIDATGNAYHSGADGTVRGVCIGFELAPIPTIMNGNGPISIDYMAAAFAGSVVLCIDPNATFECWSDNTIGAVQANVGGTFNLGDAAPDQLFRQSRQFLNVNGGAGAQFKLIKLLASPADNSPGPACRVQVKLAQTF